jgi:hypothetical protein
LPGGFYRGVYNGIYLRAEIYPQHFRLCDFAFKGCLPTAFGITSYFFGVDIRHRPKVGAKVRSLLIYLSKTKIRDICWVTVSRGLTFGADRCVLNKNYRFVSAWELAGNIGFAGEAFIVEFVRKTN